MANQFKFKSPKKVEAVIQIYGTVAYDKAFQTTCTIIRQLQVREYPFFLSEKHFSFAAQREQSAK